MDERLFCNDRLFDGIGGRFRLLDARLLRRVAVLDENTAVDEREFEEDVEVERFPTEGRGLLFVDRPQAHDTNARISRRKALEPFILSPL